MGQGGVPCPKPTPRALEKRRAKRQRFILRRLCKDFVWKRDRGQCVLCHAHVVRPKQEPSPFDGHVDEILPKSLGGDPLDPNNCRLLCVKCHFPGPSGAHRKTIREEGVDAVKREE